MSARLKSGIWVQAQIRLLDQQGISAMVLAKGDPDSGEILIKWRKVFGDCWQVFARYQDFEAVEKWHVISGEGTKPENEVEALIARRRKNDPDLWVLEIDDPKGLYRLG